MSLAKRYLIALFVVFLYFGAQIRAWTNVKNRYYGFWSHWDAAVILLQVCLLALIVLGVEDIVRRLGHGWLCRLFHHLFLAVLIGGIMTIPSEFSTHNYPRAMYLIWMGVMAVVGFSFGWPRSRLVHYGINTCLIFSPILLLLGVQMFVWPSWDEPAHDAPLPAASVSKGTPVIFLVFDEWSWLRSMEEGTLRPSLKNVSELCRHSVVCSHALSPVHFTAQALPRIIFQTNKEYDVVAEKTVFRDRNKVIETQKMPSLFQLSRHYQYTSYLIGWYHPYRHMLGDQVDFCNSHSWSRGNAGLMNRAAWLFQRNGQYLTDPMSRYLWPFVERRYVCSEVHEMGQTIRSQVPRVLQQSPEQSFVFLHLPWPHWPFIYREDGSYRGPTVDREDFDGYLRHLAYADHILGEVITTLRAANKYDQAMLIFTSDHGWRDDPDPEMWKIPKFNRRVPLIIKLPGQTSGCVIDDEICSNRLKPLLEAVFSGKTDTEELLELLRQCTTPHDQTQAERPATEAGSLAGS